MSGQAWAQLALLVLQLVFLAVQIRLLVLTRRSALRAEAALRSMQASTVHSNLAA